MGNIDDVRKMLTSLQIFVCQKIDIELVNTSAKFGYASIHTLMGFMEGDWIGKYLM